jgi:hypothetical protein
VAAAGTGAAMASTFLGALPFHVPAVKLIQGEGPDREGGANPALRCRPCRATLITNKARGVNSPRFSRHGADQTAHR